MQLNYLKEVSKKSKNSLHTKEKKKFAFCAFGRPQGQKNTPAVYVLGKYLKQNHFLIKLQALGFNSSKNKLLHSCFLKMLIKSAEELHFKTAFCSTPTFEEHHLSSPFTAANSNP